MLRSVLLNFFGIVTGGIIYNYYSYYSFMVKSFRTEYAVIENVFTSTWIIEIKKIRWLLRIL